MDRTSRMASMFSSGKTYAEIGEYFGVSRQRVHSLLSKIGYTRESGGKHLSAEIKQDNLRKGRDKKSLKKYGFLHAEMLEFKKAGAYRRYLAQRESAKFRGIEWKLTFPQWITAWKESGHWGERGKTKFAYCMARKGDVGPYSLGNIYFCTVSQNCSESRKKERL